MQHCLLFPACIGFVMRRSPVTVSCHGHHGATGGPPIAPGRGLAAAPESPPVFSMCCCETERGVQMQPALSPLWLYSVSEGQFWGSMDVWLWLSAVPNNARSSASSLAASDQHVI